MCIVGSDYQCAAALPSTKLLPIAIMHQLASSCSNLFHINSRCALLHRLQVRYVGVSNETSYGVSEFIHAAKATGLPRIQTIQNCEWCSSPNVGSHCTAVAV